MAKPNKKRKVVNQTGYDDANVAPFSENYQDLYRGMLTKHRLLYKKVEKIAYFVEKLNMIKLNQLDKETERNKYAEILNELNELVEDDDERV